MTLVGARRVVLLGTETGIGSPLQVAGLAFWLDASDLSTLFQDDGFLTPVSADGQPVGGWQDKSGQGSHVIQAVAGSQPTYKTNIIAGRPVVRFDGTADQLQLSPAPAGLQVNSFTYLVVVKAANLEGGRPLQVGTDGVAAASYMRIRSTGAVGNLQLISYVAASPSSAIGSLVVGTAAFRVLTMVRDAASLRQFGYVDGVLDPQGAVTGAVADYGAGPILGLGSTTTGFVNGDIAEVLIYTRALPSRDRRQVERYLGKKYGLAVA